MTAQIRDLIECGGRRMRLRSDIPLPRKHARVRKVENGRVVDMHGPRPV